MPRTLNDYQKWWQDRVRMFPLKKSKTAVRDLDPTNDICFLRLRTKKNEILLAPGKIQFICNLFVTENNRAYLFHIDGDFSLIVIQAPMNSDQQWLGTTNTAQHRPFKENRDAPIAPIGFFVLRCETRILLAIWCEWPNAVLIFRRTNFLQKILQLTTD